MFHGDCCADVKCTVCVQIFAVRLVLRDAEVVEVADKL